MDSNDLIKLLNALGMIEVKGLQNVKLMASCIDFVEKKVAELEKKELAEALTTE